MKPEFPGLRELAHTRAKAEKAVSRNTGSEVGHRFANIVDAIFLYSEDVAIRIFRVRSRRGFGQEVVEGAAGVIGQLFEESLRLGVC